MAIDTFFCISRFLIIPSRVSFKDAFLVVGGGGGGGFCGEKSMSGMSLYHSPLAPTQSE